MRLTNLLRIVGIALLLAVYSRMLLESRPAHPGETLANPVASDGLPLLRLSQAQALWQAEGTLFVDVRSGEDYRFGHIAGAISLPEREIEKWLPRFRSRLERARAIVVYCGSRDCGISLWAALRLRNEGLTQTWIYPGGWNEWVTNDLPTAGRS